MLSNGFLQSSNLFHWPFLERKRKKPLPKVPYRTSLLHLSMPRHLAFPMPSLPFLFESLFLVVSDLNAGHHTNFVSRQHQATILLAWEKYNNLKVWLKFSEFEPFIRVWSEWYSSYQWPFHLVSVWKGAYFSIIHVS